MKPMQRASSTISSFFVESPGARLAFIVSAFDGDNMCLDLAVHRAAPEALGDGLGRDVGCFAKPRGVARLDLVSQRRALAICDRRNTRRARAAACRDRIDARLASESSTGEIALDDLAVVV